MTEDERFEEWWFDTIGSMDGDEYAPYLGNKDRFRECWNAALTNQWKPIETAPKDRDILLSDGIIVSQGGWITDRDQGADYEGQFGSSAWWSIDSIEKPTHWMPRPAPPKEKK